MPFFVKIHDKVGTDYEKDNQYEVINIEIMENKDEIEKPEEIKGVGRIIELELCPPLLIGYNIFKNIGILSVIECLHGTDIRPIVPTRFTSCKKTKLECGECKKCQTQDDIHYFPRALAHLFRVLFLGLVFFSRKFYGNDACPRVYGSFYRWYYLRRSDLGPGSSAAGLKNFYQWNERVRIKKNSGRYMLVTSSTGMTGNPGMYLQRLFISRIKSDFCRAKTYILSFCNEDNETPLYCAPAGVV
jgi:hypothetical protein